MVFENTARKPTQKFRKARIMIIRSPKMAKVRLTLRFSMVRVLSRAVTTVTPVTMTSGPPASFAACSISSSSGSVT